MLFTQKVPASESLSQVLQWGPCGERYPLTGHFYVSLITFYLSLRVPGKGAPSMFPNRVPTDRDTPSPESLVYLLIYSFIHVCLPESPKRSPPAYGEKRKVTVHGAPRRRKAYIQWDAAWFPKGIVNDTDVSTPVPCSLWHDIFHLGLGKSEPLSQRVS
jgi:hypothetical protein